MSGLVREQRYGDDFDEAASPRLQMALRITAS